MTEPRWVRAAQHASTAAIPVGVAVLFLTGMFAPALVMTGIAVLIAGLGAGMAVGYHNTVTKEDK